MIDLEERLRRDAANWHDDPPPALDEALDRALAARSRAGARTALALAACAVAVSAAVLTVIHWPRTAHRVPAATTVRPQPAVVPLPHVRFSVAVIPKNGLGVIFAVVPTTGAQCGATQIYIRSQVETQKGIQIVLAGQRPGGAIHCGRPGSDDTAVPVYLRASLGNRTVYDDTARRAVVDLNSIPVAGYVPPGYRSTRRGAMSGGALTARRVYRTSPGGRLLTVAYSVVGVAEPVPAGSQTVEVNGHQARFDPDAPHCLGWSPSRWVLATVCGNDFLPSSEIVKVARSLH